MRPTNASALTCVLAFAIAVTVLAGCTPSSPDNTAMANATATATLDSDRARMSYVVGLDLGRQVAAIDDDLDIEVLLQGLRTVHAGGTPLLDDAAADAVRKQLTAHLQQRRTDLEKQMAAKNLALGERFLVDNRQRDGVQVTASGLQYQVLKAGEGVRPGRDATVRMHYTGTRLDGSTLEDTRATDHPGEFVVNRLMPGLIEGLMLMPAGSRYRLWIPGPLGYGERGLAGKVEPNTLLTFDIELVEVADVVPVAAAR